MKLSNIFKKNTKTVAKANVEKLEKKQLEKVVGGTSVGSIPITAGDSVSSIPFAGGVIASANGRTA